MSALSVAEAETPLERARSGDHDAFAELVARHEGMVFSIALHFFDDRFDRTRLGRDL